METIIRQWQAVEADRVQWSKERQTLITRVAELEKVNADLQRKSQILEFGIKAERSSKVPNSVEPPTPKIPVATAGLSQETPNKQGIIRSKLSKYSTAPSSRLLEEMRQAGRADLDLLPTKLAAERKSNPVSLASVPVATPKVPPPVIASQPAVRQVARSLVCTV